VWGRYGDELRDRLDAASSPVVMLALLEEELRRRVADVPGLGLVQHANGRIAAAAGAVSIGGTPKRRAHLPVREGHVQRRRRSGGRLGRVGDPRGLFDQSHLVKDFPDLHRMHTDRVLWHCGGGSSPTIPGHALDVGPLPAD
jgi:hypothetical protein